MKIFQRHRGDFAEALEKIARARPKQRFATSAEIMDEIMNNKDDSEVVYTDALLNASINEINGRILATRDQFNPLTYNPQLTVDSLKKTSKSFDGGYLYGHFYLEGVLMNNQPVGKILDEIALLDSDKPTHKKRVIDLTKKGEVVYMWSGAPLPSKSYDLPTDSFADDDFLVFLAESKERAQKYGLFLKDNGIKNTRIILPEKLGKDHSNGIYMDDSRLLCNMSVRLASSCDDIYGVFSHWI